MTIAYRLLRGPRVPSTLIAAALMAWTTAGARAQTASTAASGSSPSGQTVQMEQMNVNTVPLDEQIVPTARPFSSVFGTDDDILEVPRNVTIISRAQLDAIDIQDVTQFSKLTSSSYTDSNFGSPANPSIRGQSADVYMNGMRERIGESGDGMPFDFNIVESVNIVPGPATAVQGATAYVGGFVDMITKQPFFDGEHGSFSYTGGSYDTNRWTLDVGGPISPKLAYRFSYSGEDSDGYWYNWLKQTTSIYDAIAWRPNDNYELNVYAHAFWADYRENFGVDRPTQAMISDGLYQSGTNINNGTAATAADPQNAANIASSNTIAWGPVVPLDYRETAQGPASHAHGQEYNLQAVQTVNVRPGLKVVDNTIWGYTKRDTFNSDGYSEILDPTWFADNRTEFIFSGDWGDVNTGLEEKYQHVIAMDDFFFEPVNVWDLSNASARVTLNYALAKSGDYGYGGVSPAGWPGRPATPGIINDDTNDSSEYAVSPYLQSTFKLAPDVDLVAGARIDMMHVEDKDPLSPGVEASVGAGEPNANLSLVYRLSPQVSTYGTVNFSENYTGDLGDGGGFGLYTDPNTGQPTLPRGLFAEQSKLFEYGIKSSTDGGSLFLSSDVFYQTRQNKPQASPVLQYEYYGFEFLANYQPNRNFFATLGYSWINGSLPAPVPFQAYATQQIPGGPPDPFTDAAAYQTTGRLRAPGQPLDTLNALASYTFDNGFGVEANALVTSEMNNDYQGYLRIPWQYELDASVFYKWQRWLVRVTATNLTNQHNWEPSDATYALEGIVPEAGFESFVTVKYSF
jgi:catecholate siderophore receptor